MKRTSLISWSCFSLMVAVSVASGAAPMGTSFTYQGQLKQEGAPLSATADVEFTLWDSAEDGNQLASATVDNADVQDGLFTVHVDFGVEVFDGQARWLQVAVRSPAGGGGFSTLAPRQLVTAAPYALQTRGIFVDGSERVGIGTTKPTRALQVEADASAAAAVYARNDGGQGFGVYGESFGEMGRGVMGIAADTAATNYGVWGASGSPSGVGVYARGAATEGTNYGIWAETFSNAGFAGYFANGRNFFAGRTGIGTTGALAKLHINGTFNGFSLNVDNVMHVTQGDRVGIGTDDPSSRLDVRDSAPGFVGRFENGNGAGVQIEQTNATTSPALSVEAAGGNTAFTLNSDGGSRLANWQLFNTSSNAAAFTMNTHGPGGGIEVFCNGPDNEVPAGTFLSNGDVAAVQIDQVGSGKGLEVRKSGEVLLTVNDDFVGVGRDKPIGAEFFGVGTPARGTSFGGMYVSTLGVDARPFYGYSAGGDIDAFTLYDGQEGHWRLVMNNTRIHVRGDNGWVGLNRTGASHPLHMESGAHVTTGGTWTNASSRAAKEDFEAVDGREVLERVAALPITSWRYKAEVAEDIRHMGPVAEDFAAAFGLGGSDEAISTVDADGVALAAIQGLREVVRAKDARIAELEDRLAKLEALVGRLAADKDDSQPQERGDETQPGL